MPGIETPIRQEAIPQEAQLVAQFDSRERLGVDFKEPGGLALLDARLDVYRTEVSPGHERFDVTIDHPPLNDKTLLALLGEVAPYKDGFGPSAGGTIGDWVILDPRDPSGQSPVRDSSGLVRLHQRLGGAWNEFALSQPAFISVLRTGETPSFGTNGHLARLANIGRSRTIVKQYIQENNDSLDGFMGRLEEAGIKGAERIVFEGIARSNIVRRNRRSQSQTAFNPQQEPELRRRFNAAPLTQRNGLLEKIVYEKLGEEARKKLSATLRGDYDWATLGDEKLAYPRKKLAKGATLADAITKPYIRSVGIYDIEAIDLPLHDGTTLVLETNGRPQRVRQGTTIQPLLSWERRDEERDFQFERTSTPIEGGPELAHTDGLLGVLALAYLQPDARAGWPKRQHIGKRVQEMEAAQVPVLALMKKSSLLGSRLVQIVEES